MLSLTALAYGLTSLLLLILGGLILWRDRDSTANRGFALFTLAMLGWIVSLFLYYRVEDSALLTLIGRINYVSIVLAIPLGYFFTLEVVERRDRFRLAELAETAALAAVTLLTPLVSAKESLAPNGEPVTHFGPLFPLFVLHLVAYLLAATARLVQSARRASAQRRAQLRVILAGFLTTAAVAITTNVVLPAGFGYFRLQEAGALSVVFLIAAFAYAIGFQGLFDVRIVVKRTVIFTGLIGGLIGLYGALALVATQVLRKAPVTAQEFLFNLAAVAIVGMTSEPLRRLIAARTDRWLYQKDYEQHAAVANLNNQLSATFDLDQALDAVLETLRRSLHLNHAIAYVFEPGEDGTLTHRTIRQLGSRSSAKLFLNERDGVIEYFSKAPAVLEVSASASERLRQSAGERADSVTAKLRALDIEVAAPVHQAGKLSGLLLLGKKRSGDPYTQRDLAFVSLVTGPMLSSIQKAKLYEGDQAKTEFVSVAAHELLTPLTGMQGYLSMVLDEGMGHVDQQAKGYLDKVYVSAKRLAELVKDLLSVSRVESGRVKMDIKPLNVVPLIRDAIDQVELMAKANGLTITFEAPQRIPAVLADANRLMEVLVNLVGNAVKYTPQGSVTISTSEEGTRLKVAVRDTGLGMTEEARKHLFEKFYRIRTKETEDISGTGLGLYVTKSMIEKMGGSISVASTPGLGSTFAITLPIAK
jgi:signal transduction histidine kinase